jgi:tRNA 2-thiouridine synthesizing protein A
VAADPAWIGSGLRRRRGDEARGGDSPGEETAVTALHADQELNCRGLSCPLPILRTKKALDALGSGQVLRLIATDPGSPNDMEAWTRSTGHALLQAEQPQGEYVFYIQKK